MATILIVDDDAALREGLRETLSDLGHAVLEAPDGAAALALATRHRPEAVLLDLRMPGMDGIEVLARLRALPAPPAVAILTAYATAENTIEAMRLGAADHLVKPVGRADLAALLGRLLPGGDEAAALPTPPPGREALIGTSSGIRTVHKTIGLLADSEATVLISGETGTGKEVVARAIHEHGRRRDKPFVAVNCAAIPSELLESQLFGHVRGAFTGAVADRAGSFREAQNGTLFLDEIGDMDAALQAKLLRVVQERVVQPVGGRPVAVDVRILSATHRDLRAEVAAGRFREDLFYRLGVVPVTLPPLRERESDIIPLANRFLHEAGTPHRPAKRLAADAARLLLVHPWPGNVRELQNAMQRATALSRAPVLTAKDFAFLGEATADAPGDGRGGAWLSGTLGEAVERLERAMIGRALERAGGSRAEAARSLGVNRQFLHRKMQAYGIRG